MKRPSKIELIQCGEFLYKINGGENRPIYFEILTPFIKQTEAMLSHHSKVLALFVNFHPREFEENNQIFTTNLKKTLDAIKRKYRLKRLGFMWARELGESKKQHYHACILLDAHKVNFHFKVIEIIKEFYEQRYDLGSIWKPKNPVYILKRDEPEQLGEFIYRLSYFAKTKSKGNKSKYTKEFGCSRLKEKTRDC